jgi:hypothetical protein
MNAADMVLRVIDALEKLNVPYMTVGSFSSNVYGQPRSTKDADFVIELTHVTITALAQQIGTDFVLDPQMSFETISATMRYRLKHRDSAFLIELFLLSDDPHDRSRFARRVPGDIGGRRVFVPTAEDVIITKLRWAKGGRRSKDVDDVWNVLAVQTPARLDLAYIRHWCDLHQTRGLFETLVTEVSASL